MKIEYKFENNINEKTSVDIYLPDFKLLENKKRPMVLMIHGFRAFKTWGFFPYFAEQITRAGYFCSIIDFSLNTLIDAEKCLFDMERFSKNTVSQEITEAELFVERFTSGDVLDADLMNYWNGEIYLIGHSLGGALAIMVAHNDNADNKNMENVKKNHTEKKHIIQKNIVKNVVKKIVTICSISDFDIYTERQKKDWVAKGIKEFKDTSTGQLFQLDVKFLLDRLEYSGEMSLAACVSRLKIPYLILHTEGDVTVSPNAATILFDAASKEFAQKIMVSGNHLLGVSHPFEGTNEILENVIRKSIDFMEQ